MNLKTTIMTLAVLGQLGLAVAEEHIHTLAALEVVTTGTRTERLATEVPIRTEVLGSDLFSQIRATDLASALEYLPGARVEANCQNCGTSEVKLLDLGAGYNQLLFNGQPLFSGLAAVYGLEHIPTAFIERVEVVKGGASSLYGPGAVAGVINIIPHEPLFNQRQVELSVELLKGEPSSLLVGIWDWVDLAHRAAVTTFVEARHNESVDLNKDGFSEITRKDFLTLGTNFWLYPAKGTRISGNYAFTWEERRGGNRMDLLPHESQITEQLEHRWHRGGLTLEHDVNPDWKVSSSLSLSHIDRDSYYGGVGNVPLPGEEGFNELQYNTALEEAAKLYGFTKTTRFYFDALSTWNGGHHAITFGAQYHYDDVFDEKRDQLNRALRADGELASRSGEDPIANGTFSNTGIFIQDEWDPADKLTIISGLRIDRHSELDNWILSPRMAVRFTPDTAWILRASVATGFRAPEIFDEDFHIEILDDPTRTRNADGLKEEQSVSYTAGFVWAPEILDSRLQIDVEAYRTNLNNSFSVSDIVYEDASGNAYKERQNTSGAVVQGIEVNARYRASSSLTIEGGVSYSDATFDESVEVLPGIHERRFLESPKWSGVAKINYTFNGHTDLFLGMIYTGPMVAARELEQSLNHDTGNFFVIDFSATRHIDIHLGDAELHMDLTIGVRNLLDHRQGDLTSGAERDTTYFYGPRFPRSFFITARLKF
jgi:outer membrane receptor for ferrienterochelin and colicins